MDERNIRFLNVIMVVFFAVQLPVCFYKFTLYGVNEKTMGTYGVGGGPSALLPIIVLGYCIGFYFFYKKNIFYLFFAIAFMLYGFLGAKRALIFLYPLFFTIIYYLCCIRNKAVGISQHFIMITIAFILTISFSVAHLKYNTTIVNDKIVTGKAAKDRVSLDYLFKFTEGYHKIARGATMDAILTQVQNGGIEKIFFGFGPGSLSKSLIIGKDEFLDQRMNNIQIRYGISGIMYILCEYGIIGLIPILLLYLSFVRLCWLYYKYEQCPYWKGFATGSLIFAILCLWDFLFYSTMSLTNELILPIFYYALAVVHIMGRKDNNQISGDSSHRVFLGNRE